MNKKVQNNLFNIIGLLSLALVVIEEVNDEVESLNSNLKKGDKPYDKRGRSKTKGNRYRNQRSRR
ncbi:MAG: hypothetical protein IKB70_04385 [Bacilli bacterium]|nr:hypothetical protein [Bacilli bacterium]